MLEIKVWLIVAAIGVLSLQGIELAQLKPRWILWLVAFLVIALSYLSSDFIAAQNILVWQKFAAQQQQTIQIVVLLELTLAVFLRYRIMPISSLFAFIYGQLLLFQQGWFDWAFQWQGLLFGIAIACLWFINKNLSKSEKYWPQLVLFVVALSTVLSAATPPQPVSTGTNWQEMSVSLVLLASIVTTGIAIEQFNKFRSHQ